MANHESGTPHRNETASKGGPENDFSSTAKHDLTTPHFLSRKRQKHASGEAKAGRDELEEVKPDDAGDMKRSAGQSTMIIDRHEVLLAMPQRRSRPKAIAARCNKAVKLKWGRGKGNGFEAQKARPSRRNDFSSQERRQAREAMDPDRERTPEEEIQAVEPFVFTTRSAT